MFREVLKVIFSTFIKMTANRSLNAFQILRVYRRFRKVSSHYLQLRGRAFFAEKRTFFNF